MDNHTWDTLGYAFRREYIAVSSKVPLEPIPEEKTLLDQVQNGQLRVLAEMTLAIQKNGAI